MPVPGLHVHVPFFSAHNIQIKPGHLDISIPVILSDPAFRTCCDVDVVTCELSHLLRHLLGLTWENMDGLYLCHL